jgi:hypothetical protein
MLTDTDWLITNNIDMDGYAFTERVGIILEDSAANPSDMQLQQARQQAVRELYDDKVSTK